MKQSNVKFMQFVVWPEELMSPNSFDFSYYSYELLFLIRPHQPLTLLKGNKY